MVILKSRAIPQKIERWQRLVPSEREILVL